MRRTSVTFVVTEVLGSVKNGGIATATTHAALVLARHGYDIELLYCGHHNLETAWSRTYTQAGVRVRHLDRAPQAAPSFAADGHRVYLALRDSATDVAVVQDWQGLGHAAARAKRAGELARTKLVHICHGPTAWLQEANRRLDADARSLATARLEQTSAEAADCIVSPSAHLLDWMRRRGWQLPDTTAVIPYFTEAHVTSLDARPRPKPGGEPLEELVFFGRLEERKGVRVFTEALARLDPSLLRGRRVTFLGREATVRRTEVESWLAPVRTGLAELRFEGDLDQAGARAYLRRGHLLAVVPSLLDNSPNVIYECIDDGVPLLASAAGGSGELVAEGDRARTLFAPTPAALAAALGPILRAGTTPAPPSPAYDGRASLERWREVLRPSPPRPVVPAVPRRGTDVTLVITTFDADPEHLLEAVDSVRDQTEPVAEIVVVDDGSTEAAALDTLDRLATTAGDPPLRVLRQENRYLGAARNAGLRAARTELVAFLDDDDALDRSFVAALLDALRHMPSATAVVPTLLAVDADPLGRFGDDAQGVAWIWTDADPALGPVWNVFGGAGMLVRRSVVLEAGGFHELPGVGHEDWELLLRLSLRGERIVHVPRPLYRYRIRPGSMIRSTSTWQNMQPVFAACADALPPALARWPEVLRGQHEQLEHLRAEVGWLHAELDRLYVELERRTRWFELRTGLGVPELDVDR